MSDRRQKYTFDMVLNNWTSHVEEHFMTNNEAIEYGKKLVQKLGISTSYYLCQIYPSHMREVVESRTLMDDGV